MELSVAPVTGLLRPPTNFFVMCNLTKKSIGSIMLRFLFLAPPQQRHPSFPQQHVEKQGFLLPFVSLRGHIARGGGVRTLSQ